MINKAGNDYVHVAKVALSRFRVTIVGGKAISITYSECVPIALVIQHAVGMRHIVNCGLSGSTFFSPCVITLFSRGKVIEHEMYNFCVKHFSL